MRRDMQRVVEIISSIVRRIPTLELYTLAPNKLAHELFPILPGHREAERVGLFVIQRKRLLSMAIMDNFPCRCQSKVWETLIPSRTEGGEAHAFVASPDVGI